MTGILPDVNLLLAFAWESHTEHRRARSWLASVENFSTCPITELGFLRVSMSPAYCASFGDALSVLHALHRLESALRINDDFDALAIPEVSRYKDTTDAYLVSLADSHQLRLATLDKGILKADWASGIAFDPFAASS